MKSALLLIVFTFISIDVFGADVEVMVGDSVTLHTDTIIQTEDVVEWSFGQESIAMIDEGSIEITASDEKLKDRLQLDNQTGALMIRHIKTTDSGDYKLDITRITGSFKKTFNVKVVSADVSADAVESVSVMKGDSVTLQTDRTDLPRNVIQWKFEHQNSPVAEINRVTGILNTYDGPDGRFRGRLQLNNQTGSLTIMNIGTKHSGRYEVEISSTSSSYTIQHTQSFSLTVSDDVESVSVMVGDSITLHTGFTKDYKIRWTFRDTFIADLNNPVNEKWGNIHLNLQTGNLIISNISGIQAGDYKVEIKTRTMTLHRKYPVTVIDAVKKLSVMEGDSVTLQTDTEIQSNNVIRWKFGDTVIAEINKADPQPPISSIPDGRFRDRLKLNNQTGSLTITNTKTTDSGDYELRISSNRRTINRRFTVTVTDSGLSTGAVAGIVVGVLGVVLGAAAAVGIYNHHKNSKLGSHGQENGQNQQNQDTKNDPPNERVNSPMIPEAENSSSL